MMPETYTQEQIDEAMKFLRGITSDSETMNSSIMILLSALSTAEKNNADWQEYNAELLHRAETAERERDAAEAQVAGLEARLQGAGWISVKEWLPPMETVFDVWDSYHNCRLADHGAFTGAWDGDFMRETMLIKGYTHWMPLPEPPAIAKKEGE